MSHLYLSIHLYFSGIKNFLSCGLGMDNFGGMNNMDRFGSGSGMGRMNGKESLTCVEHSKAGVRTFTFC